MRGIVAFVLTVSAMSAVSQQEIPHFKSGVDVVQFTVTVTHKYRHPISGLAASDFEVLVDGAPRPLAAFAAVTLPADPSVAATSILPVAPDVLTNQLAPEGRLVVIVMDRSTPDGRPIAPGSTRPRPGPRSTRGRCEHRTNLLTVGELHAAPGALPVEGRTRAADCQCDRAAPARRAGGSRRRRLRHWRSLAGSGRYVVTIEVSDGRRAARREVPSGCAEPRKRRNPHE